MTIRSQHRRWLAEYGLTLGALIGLALLLHLRMLTYRDPPVDFYAMKPGEIFVVHGLTRRQEGSVKLGFADAFQPPQIGLYGNHIIAGFGADAFGRAEDAEFFFNYSFANLSLPEIHRYLRHVEKLGHLPRKLILVQITPPNADNGRFIINWGNELPPDVMLSDPPEGGSIPSGLQLAALSWEIVENWLHEVFNYNTFISGLIQGGDKGRVVGASVCQGASSAWLDRLPSVIRSAVGGTAGPGFYCRPAAWVGALRRDGSGGSLEVEVAPNRAGPPLVANENPLNDSDRGLNASDETEIARHLHAIDAVGRRHGLQVVFIVPPVYETNRDDSVVNRIFNRALALAPDIEVIDSRALHSDPSLFSTPIHPAPRFGHVVVDELRRRGFLD
jgi:hypothetical protein